MSVNKLNLDDALDDVVDWRYKGFPPTAEPVKVGAIGDRKWEALAGDLLMPLLVIRETALDHNIQLMARYCALHGVSHAPHAKTPMAPQILQRQLDAGAWGITAATINEVRVFRVFGVQRILLANQLIEPAAIRWIVNELNRDKEFEFFFLVDSWAGLATLRKVLEIADLTRPLRVLLEFGVTDGRSGCRSTDDALRLADEVVRAPGVQLCGLEGYEGVINAQSLDDRIARVDSFVSGLRDLTMRLASAGVFDDLDEIVVTAGGSLYFDRVAEGLGKPWSLSRPVRVVLRSGSYVAHDSDAQERLSPLAGRSVGGERLRPALELWSMITSTPEPGLAIAGFGKRDVSYDLRLPIPQLVVRCGATRAVTTEIEVTALYDQHALLRVDPEFDLAVGDLLGCGISHPCTAFDKWRLLPVVDDRYRVTGAIKTYF